MEIEILSQFSEAEKPWREIIAKSQIESPFLLFEWQKAWFSCIGHGEPQILVVKMGNDPVGLLPLIKDGQNLTFIGTDLSDYLDVIAVQKDKKAVLKKVITFLFVKKRPRRLVLTNLPSGSTTPKIVSSLAVKLGLKVKKEKAAKTPSIVLPKTWEDYLTFLSRKNRHELRRKIRRLEKRAPDFQIEKSQNPAVEIKAFLHLMEKSRPEKALFLTHERELFFKTIAREMPAKILDLTFLKIKQKPVAAILGFWGSSTFFLYNSGLDPAFKRLSAGLLLKAFSIKRAISAGLGKYDFMLGDEHYKYQLGAKDEWVYNLTVEK